MAELLHTHAGAAVLGFGVDGSATAAWLAARGLAVTVLDDSEASRERAIEAGYTALPLTDTSLPSDTTLVVRSPGIPPATPVLAAALDEDQRTVLTSLDLWLAYQRPSVVVGVTGTKGKTTTRGLINALLTAAGVDSIEGGNTSNAVLGPPLTGPGESPDVAIVEISSFVAAAMSQPIDIAVLTSLWVDHLDWHGSERAYHRDKLRLLSPDISGSALAHAENAEAVQTHTDRAPHIVKVPEQDETRRKALARCGLRGPHNERNLALALDAAEQVLTLQGAEAPPLESWLENLAQTHRAPHHRLEPVAALWRDDDTVIEFVNDSIATIPEAAAAGLEAFPKRRVAMIIGGFDRGVSQAALITSLQTAAARKQLVHVFGLPTTGHDIIAQLTDVPCTTVESVTEAVERAAATSDADLVLLSPGAASFSQFTNYVERAEAFIDAALAIGATRIDS